jgi:hypothetical protein
MKFAVITCYHVYIKESTARISTTIFQVATDFPYILVHSKATVYYYQVIVEGGLMMMKEERCALLHIW